MEDLNDKNRTGRIHENGCRMWRQIVRMGM
jgi:hypothetical protein